MWGISPHIQITVLLAQNTPSWCVDGFAPLKCAVASVKLTKNRVLKNVGESVRYRRTSAGLSQEKLAEKADVHRNYIGKIERGEQNLTVHSLIHIAKALRCKASDILRDASL